MFNPVADPTFFEGQLYKHLDTHWRMMGYAPGCGRHIEADYCMACRNFMPYAVDRIERKSRARPARVTETEGR
jgi:hypothetical protein